ncbi:MAG: exodeoxyribonuclease V subunit beta [Myxococcota bacterium]|jgi:exodeoxyribonuclease V beta subunit|nr:exodeoxyribonuclease V subunit beta [Myxococcota bacterium]
MKPLDAFEVDLRGTTLIEASAGTGKTFTITTLYLRLVLDERLSVDKILVITYTRAASAELRDRIRRRLGEALHAFETGETGDDDVLADLLSRFTTNAQRTLATRYLVDALADFDEAAILTIHGFCQRALREYAFESRSAFDVELLVDQGALLREVGADVWSHVIAEEDPSVVDFMRSKFPKIEKWLGVARHGADADPPRVIPEAERFSRDTVEKRVAKWRDVLSEVRAQWEREGHDVLSLLERSDQLNRRSYSVKNIQTIWRRDTEALLQDDRLPISSEGPRKKLARLGASGIEAGTKKGKAPPDHPFFGACEALLAANDDAAEALRDRQVSLERRLISETTKQLAERKREAARQSYDDLLAQMRTALVSPSGSRFAARLRSAFSAALVDEFQDTDQLQYEIVRRIWHDANAPLFLIGDPKQAIYAFRGADVHAYLRAKGDASERCFTLNVNWRSDPGLIDALASLFSPDNGSPFRMEEIRFEAVTARPGAVDALAPPKGESSPGALDLLFLEREGDKPIDKARVSEVVPWRVAADIARLLASETSIDGRPVGPGDIAVLCRTNDQTLRMVNALRAAGVAAALLGNASVLDSDEALDIERILEAIAEPRSLSRIRAALATRIFGKIAADFDGWRKDEFAWDPWLERFGAWHETWNRHGFVRMFHALLHEGDVHRRLLEVEGGERRLANILHIGELAERAAQGDHLGPQGMVQWLSRMRSDRELRGNAVGEEGELRLESDRAAVRVVTIHKSKGLEYPIVYCPFLFASAELQQAAKARTRFHMASDDPERDGEVVLDLGSPEHAENIERAREENLAEGTRMLYVALTRAKHRCSVVWGAVRDADKSALFPLLHPELDAAGWKQLDDGGLRGELEAFAESAAGSISVRSLSGDEAPRPQPAVQPPPGEAPEVSRVLTSTWRHSSFSQLAASDREVVPVLPPLRAEGADRDEVDAQDIEASEPLPEGECLFEGLAPGARTGVLLHSILEHLDFREPVNPQLEGELAGLLDRHGVDEVARGPLGRDIERVLDAPIGDQGLCLRALACGARLDEVEFLVPVAEQADGLRAAHLAALFREFADDEVSRQLAVDYAPRLERLRFESLTGYLRGFVDLMFEWRGRYYVVDYKSNHLGDNAADYQPAALLHPMQEHHYVLQYHLYTVAIDRYLAARVADYDYETHFGGVYYLFLRGMDPSAPTGTGIFQHRPSAARIAALSALLDAPGVAAA